MLGLRSLISFGAKRTVALNVAATAPAQLAKLAPVFNTYNTTIGRNFMTMPSTSLYISSVARIAAAPKEPLTTGVRQMSSLQKKRRAKMNKHKLKKRRKSLKYNTKQSRA